MNQIDAAISQYTKTIVDLSGRLAQAAAELAAAQERIEELEKSKPKLEVVPNEKPADLPAAG